MTQARSHIVAAETTPYYHVMGRCVRRGFLCGFDQASGIDYEHRRGWIVDRMSDLVDIFAIDVLAYAVMSNHYHLAVQLRPSRATAWSNEEVVARWKALYGLPLLLERWQSSQCGEAERDVALSMIQQRRERLTSLSWFMKCLNEPIARRANREDHCTGAFWEGRFKSQALLDERALLACMAYVDLNPVRAKIAETPETSDYTSVQARIQMKEPVRLVLFRDQVPIPERDDAIPFYLADYLSLVDWTGRASRQDKRGQIKNDLPPILDRLGFDQTAWFQTMAVFNNGYPMIGSAEAIRAAARQATRHWFKGVNDMAAFSTS